MFRLLYYVHTMKFLAAKHAQAHVYRYEIVQWARFNSNKNGKENSPYIA